MPLPPEALNAVAMPPSSHFWPCRCPAMTPQDMLEGGWVAPEAGRRTRQQHRRLSE